MTDLTNDLPVPSDMAEVNTSPVQTISFLELPQEIWDKIYAVWYGHILTDMQVYEARLSTTKDQPNLKLHEQIQRITLIKLFD